MFSPATKRSNMNSAKERTSHLQPPSLQPQPQPNNSTGGSPITPLAESWKPVALNSSVPNRPSTGTPAPWASRLSVLARILHVKKNDEGDDVDSIHPVYVGEFPQVVRDEQAIILQRRVSGDAGISGGMDRGTSLAWIICGSRLFIWSYLSHGPSRKCVDLDIPSNAFENRDVSRSNSWLLSIVAGDCMCKSSDKAVQQKYSAGQGRLNDIGGPVLKIKVRPYRITKTHFFGN